MGKMKKSDLVRGLTACAALLTLFCQAPAFAQVDDYLAAIGE
jgi:hypothetical protein